MPEYSEKVKRIIDLYDHHFNNEMAISDFVRTQNLTEEEAGQIINFTVNHPHAIRSKEMIQDVNIIKKIQENIGNRDFHG